jgi:hypothetical protein
MTRFGVDAFVPEHPIAKFGKVQGRFHDSQSIISREHFGGAARNGLYHVRVRSKQCCGGEIGNAHGDMARPADRGAFAHSMRDSRGAYTGALPDRSR